MSAVIDDPGTAQQTGSPAPLQTEAQALTRLLTGVMALGQMNGMRSEVQKILLLLNEMVLDRHPLLINLAMASAVMGDGSVADTLLREGVEHWPDAEMAIISLATALQLVGNPQWQDYVQRLLATTSDARVRQLAEIMLVAHAVASE